MKKRGEEAQLHALPVPASEGGGRHPHAQPSQPQGKSFWKRGPHSRPARDGVDNRHHRPAGNLTPVVQPVANVDTVFHIEWHSLIN
jgi:hypothetical protein